MLCVDISWWWWLNGLTSYCCQLVNCFIPFYFFIKMWNFNSHHEIPFVIKTPVFLWVDWIGKRSLRLASTSVQEFSWINNNSHKMNFVRSSALDLTKKSSALDLTEKNPNLWFLHVSTRFYKENRAKLSTIGFLLTRFQAMQPIINGIIIACMRLFKALDWILILHPNWYWWHNSDMSL